MGTEVTGTGWGKTLPVEGNAPNAVLLKVNLKVMDQTQCTNLPGYGPQKIQGKSLLRRESKAVDLSGRQRRSDHLHERRPDTRRHHQLGQEALHRRRAARCLHARLRAYIDWINQAMKLDPTKNSLP